MHVAVVRLFVCMYVLRAARCRVQFGHVRFQAVGYKFDASCFAIKLFNVSAIMDWSRRDLGSCLLHPESNFRAVVFADIFGTHRFRTVVLQKQY